MTEPNRTDQAHTPRRRRIRRRGPVVAAAVVVAGLGVAGATAAGLIGDDEEPPITGDALRRASAAALDHTGGGRVTDTEVGDEDSYYEVEVTLDDGRQVDVQLDEQFRVVGATDDVEDDDGDRDG